MKLTAEDYYKRYFSENYELIKNNKGKPFFRFETMIEFAEMYSRKQLHIHNVSQPREQLLDFVSDLDDDKWLNIKMGYKENVVHEYLKSNNCG